MADVRKMRSPSPAGLNWPKPGMAVFQRMFFPDSTFHSDGGEPVPIPLPEGPRNCGQLESAAAAAIAPRTNRLVFIKLQCTAWLRIFRLEYRVLSWPSGQKRKRLRRESGGPAKIGR